MSAVSIPATPAAAAQLDEVMALPRRTAHATHALMAMSGDSGGGLLKASEVMLYDPEAMTVQSTANALTHARRLRLADGYDGLWFPTSKAWELRRALETRVLAEQDESQ